MPRVEFNTQKKCLDWSHLVAKPNKHIVYTTQSNEIVFEPKSSTSPVRFGYYPCVSGEVFLETIQLLREGGYTIIPCARYEFASDRMIVGRTSSAGQRQ